MGLVHARSPIINVVVNQGAQLSFNANEIFPSLAISSPHCGPLQFILFTLINDILLLQYSI